VPIEELEICTKGFIRPRGDAWELRVFLGTDPVTNKKRYASKTVHGGKREAQRSLNEMITEAGEDCPLEPMQPSVSDRAWFEFAAQDFSPSTVQSAWELYVRDVFDEIATSAADPAELSDEDALSMAVSELKALRRRRRAG